MARYGPHADRLSDPLVEQIWTLIRNCDRMQALAVRNLAAHHVAGLEGFRDEGRKGYSEDELILAILEADLAKREGTRDAETRERGAPLRTIADYMEWKAEDAASASTVCRAFGGWPDAMKAAHAYAVQGSNRHLMIKEGVSQTGVKREPVNVHECVVAYADCMEANFGHRPSWEQYQTWARNESEHRPSAKTVSAKLGGWYAAGDRAADYVAAYPKRFPRSVRLLRVRNGLKAAAAERGDDAQ